MRSALVLVALVSACTTPMDLARDVPVATDATFDLLPPSALGRSVALEQTVEARTERRSDSMDCVLEVDPEELRLVGLMPFGAVAFAVVLDASGVHVDVPSGGRLPADPRRILADIQLSLWPALTTLEGLDVIERSAPGCHHERVLMRGDREIVRIRYSSRGLPWEGPIEFEHVEGGYTLIITTVRWETLDP